MDISNNPQDFETQVLDGLASLNMKVTKLDEDLRATNKTVTKLDEDLRATNETVARWDTRLWTLCTSLIGTSFAAIFAAAGVVIFKSLAG
ncbi:MAG: hypothetical protein WA902_17430 [Thermosynechococcaceae cyanobacterium]